MGKGEREKANRGMQSVVRLCMLALVTRIVTLMLSSTAPACCITTFLSVPSDLQLLPTPTCQRA